MKISCIMNTYRRFTCVNRSIRLFLNQDSDVEKELIIYNTDTEYPMTLSENLLNKNIRVINNNTDLITGEDYKNIGSIRRDSLTFAEGTHYICWDDDDIFLPWHIRQCVDGFNKNPEIWSWKPLISMYWKHNGDIELAFNNMEASILVNLEKLKSIGFLPHQGGGEHLYWMDVFKKQRKFYEERNIVPSYCFNWSDKGIVAGHKQSGSIDRPDNFEFHKQNTKDFAQRPIDGICDTQEIYKKHIELLKNNIEVEQEIFKIPFVIKKETYQKYCEQYQ
jgi:hypothetical protein